MNDFDAIIDRRNTNSLKWDKYRGRDILPMWVADMDFRAPQPVIQAIGNCVDHGVFGYTTPPPELRETIVQRMRSLFGWQIEPSWIIWLPGLVSGLNLVCRAIGSPGDDVLTMIPVYAPFLSAPVHGGRNCVTVELVNDGGRWKFQMEDLERAVTPRTRLLLLCSPHNPSGRAFTSVELRTLADFCIAHDLIICTDEIHCDLILDDRRHIPIASIGADVAKRTITLMAPSKTYNIPGLVCSFAIISDDSLRHTTAMEMRGIVGDVNTMGFAACLAAYRDGDAWLNELIPYLRANRDLVERFVREELPGLSMNHVEATYLAWIDARALGVTQPGTLFEQHGVGLSDGKQYGKEGFVRLNFGCPRATLEEGLRRMKLAVDASRPR